MECLGHRGSEITVLERRFQAINSKEDREIILRVWLCSQLEIKDGLSIGPVGSTFQSPGGPSAIREQEQIEEGTGRSVGGPQRPAKWCR